MSIPAERRAVYSHGRFYKPVVPLRRRGWFRVLDVLIPVDELDTVDSEKGAEIVGDDWDHASIFGLSSALSPTSTRSAVSASALHDVCSQAMKNLMYLQPLAEDRPKATNCTSPRRSRGVRGTATRQRVRSFASTDAIWQHIRGVISDPRAEREVWMLVGRALSRSALEAQARRQQPIAEALQIYSLLQTTWGAVSQVGARLRIFCSPS